MNRATDANTNPLRVVGPRVGRGFCQIRYETKAGAAVTVRGIAQPACGRGATALAGANLMIGGAGSITKLDLHRARGAPGNHGHPGETTMSHYYWRCYWGITKSINSMEMNNWIVVGVLVVLIGLICLRGYGSRKNY